MEIIDVRNMVYTETGAIDCEVLVGEQWLPFCASKEDSMDYGAALYHDALEGKWGDIKAYIGPAATLATPVIPADLKLDELMQSAEAKIALLSRAVKHGMATDEEIADLEAWERFTVELSRVDLSDPTWPERPGEAANG